MQEFTLTSTAFENNGTIPAEYTCDGKGGNPPFMISGVPEGAKSLVLVMDDADIPEEVKSEMGIKKYDHLVVYNIDPSTSEIQAGGLRGDFGLNSQGQTTFSPPCPPPQYEPTTHRYVFRLYAIKDTLNFINPPTLNEVEIAAASMSLGKAELVGVYDRSNNA